FETDHVGEIERYRKFQWRGIIDMLAGVQPTTIWTNLFLRLQAETGFSVDNSSLINSAYHTLRDPYQRALYMLRIRYDISIDEGSRATVHCVSILPYWTLSLFLCRLPSLLFSLQFSFSLPDALIRWQAMSKPNRNFYSR